jgi:hypothetical protein
MALPFSFRRLFASKSPAPLRRLGRRRLALEALEDRLAPAVFNVNSLLDLSLAPGVNPDGTIKGTTTVTLRSAIQAANTTPGGITINLTLRGTYQITLAPTTPNESDNLAGEFAILPEGDLSIQNTSGGAVTVRGGGQSRVFDINPADTNNPATAFLVTMQGFTITNGMAFDATGTNPDGPVAAGGGIRDQGNQSLTLTDMVLSGNKATADGGGVAMENTVNSTWTLTINASTISDNNAGDSGGGVETDGSGTVVINTGTVISDNTAAYEGAGVCLDAIGTASANLSMTGVLVSGNSSTGFGGGLTNAGSGAVTITGCTVENNNAVQASGGGVEVEYEGFHSALGTLAIVNSNFVHNTAGIAGGAVDDSGPSLTITNSEFRDNSSAGFDSGFGGAVDFTGITLTVLGSTFVNNTASVDGGGLDIGNSGTATITNCTITGNHAGDSGGGGGINMSRDFTGTLALVNDTINGNSSSDGGGVSWLGTGGTVAVQNTIIAQNSATSGPDASSGFASVPAPFTDKGGNLIGIAGPGSGNTGFTAATTQTGTVATPLRPLLAPLANNGGPTIGAPGLTQTLTTEALLPGSPALDKGVSAGAPATDQRGVPRGSPPDIGAYEREVPPPPFTPPWQALGGSVTQLTAATDPNRDLEVFGIGLNHAVWVNVQTRPHGAFGGWTSLGGDLRQINVANNADGTLELFAIGSDNGVWFKQQSKNGSALSWSGWQSAGGYVRQLDAARDRSGNLELFAIGYDHAVWVNSQTHPEGGFGGWSSLGGYVKQIAVGKNSNGALQVFGIGADNAAWFREQQAWSLNWSGWQSLGGNVKQLTVGRDLNHDLELFAIGANDAVWVDSQTAQAGGFGGWSSLGGSVSQISVGASRNGDLYVFGIGVDHAAWYRRQHNARKLFWDRWISLGVDATQLTTANQANKDLDLFAISENDAPWFRKARHVKPAQKSFPRSEAGRHAGRGL